jgi:hypothetical protein
LKYFAFKVHLVFTWIEEGKYQSLLAHNYYFQLQAIYAKAIDYFEPHPLSPVCDYSRQTINAKGLAAAVQDQ